MARGSNKPRRAHGGRDSPKPHLLAASQVSPWCHSPDSAVSSVANVMPVAVVGYGGGGGGGGFGPIPGITTEV